MAPPGLGGCICWFCRVISERLEEQSVNDESPSKTGPNRAQTDPEPGQTEAEPAAGKKYRLLTLDALHSQTAAYRETNTLISEVTADLGGSEHLSAAERQMVQHGAVLGAIATDMEVQYLKGRRINLMELCTVLNSQRRCFDAVGYKRRQRDVTPTLQGFLDDLKDRDE